VRRGRLAGLLTTLLLLPACGSSVAEQDSGLPPPRDQDAGLDAGHTDAGAPEAGIDAGALGCEPDAGPSGAREGGSLVCAACLSSASCGAQGVCLFVRASTCLGSCALFGDACAGMHEVDPATGAVALSLRLLTLDGGVARAVGTATSGVASALLAASSKALWCLGERDFFAERCVERSAVLRGEASAADAGVVIRWPLRAGHLPPEPLHTVALDVLRAGDAVFRDAGVAWSRSPP
jgi:hypothetical protein